MKKLAIVGSSGGNLYNQGGSDPKGMMKEIFNQADSAGIEIGFVLFVGTTGSMDNIAAGAKAQLYTLGENDDLMISETDKLSEINKLAEAKDAELAQLIRDGQIDGLMLMSCDPNGINQASIKAAAEMQIPIAGTGGSSIAATQSMGCKVIAASGTTGTTNRTRAIAAISSFAKEWKIKYSPVIGATGKGQIQQGNIWKRINIRGIMMASLPGFIAMALCLALSKIPGLSGLEAVFNGLIGILPIILAAIAAKQISGLDEVGIVAGVVAGSMSVEGGILGGLAAGILAGILAYYIINLCFRFKVPGTTANIAAGGLSGLAAGLIGKFAIAPLALFAGDGIKSLIDMALAYNSILAGAVAGFAIWFAIIGGVYHAAILPIVLLEMEKTGFSFLGSIDMMGLVMVCAGIQLAYIIKPRRTADRTMSTTSILINVLFGTFVEAAYPYMFSNKKVFAGAIASATISGVAVGLLGVKGTAYVPAFMAPALANSGHAVATVICILIAVGSSCAFTLLATATDKVKVGAVEIEEA